MITLSSCTPQINYPGKKIIEPKIHQGQYITEDGSVLPLRTWFPANDKVKAVIVALHGFNDYSNSFNSPGTYFSHHRIACYAYDQRGFGGAPDRGLWAGIDAYTTDLSNFVRELRKLYTEVPIFILGESMGGAVTIVTMTGSKPPCVDGVILVAPAVWGRDTMPWYQRWILAIASYSVPWMELTGKGLGVVPSDNTDMLRALGRDPLVIKKTRIDALHGLTDLMDEALLRVGKLQVPVLVQYGMNDQVIPKEPTFILLKKIHKSVRKAFYVNGYHLLLRDLQGEKPLADIVSWVIDRNRPLTNGLEVWE